MAFCTTNPVTLPGTSVDDPMRQIILLLRCVVFAFALSVSSEDVIAATDTQLARSNENEQRTGMFSTEVWLTPLILLPGVALLIVSTSSRFGQLHTEIHRLLDHPDAHAKILSRHLLKRSALFRDALVSLYASVGLFSLGSLLGGVVNF